MVLTTLTEGKHKQFIVRLGGQAYSGTLTLKGTALTDPFFLSTANDGPAVRRVKRGSGPLDF